MNPGHVLPPELTIEEAFFRFHGDNPKIYHDLVAMARKWKDAGHRRCGIAMLFEALRWDYGVQSANDEFKLNNNYRSYYARLIMLSEPDLKGFFEIRSLQTDGGLFGAIEPQEFQQ